MPEAAYLITAVALVATLAGVWLTAIPEVGRRLIPFSGLLLVLLTLFWVYPELAQREGFVASAGMLLMAVGVLAAMDRFVVPICPACSHTHEHQSCYARLHGFEAPLITGALLHGIFDGWMLGSGEAELRSGGVGLMAAVAVHKLPEAFAYGAILRAALTNNWKTYVFALGLQASMLIGVGLHRHFALSLDPVVLEVALTLAGGMFLYLGGHAVHAEWRRRVTSHTHA